MISRHDYVARLLAIYRTCPDTHGRIRPADRRLAVELYQRQIGIDTLETAFLVATARRWFRSSDTPALEPICSLHYFLPVVDEIEQKPLDPLYVSYLQRRLRASNSPAHTRSPLGHETHSR